MSGATDSPGDLEQGVGEKRRCIRPDELVSVGRSSDPREVSPQLRDPVMSSYAIEETQSDQLIEGRLEHDNLPLI